jgi:hypothetical protein
MPLIRVWKGDNWMLGWKQKGKNKENLEVFENTLYFRGLESGIAWQ